MALRCRRVGAVHSIKRRLRVATRLLPLVSQQRTSLRALRRSVLCHKEKCVFSGDREATIRVLTGRRAETQKVFCFIQNCAGVVCEAPIHNAARWTAEKTPAHHAKQSHDECLSIVSHSRKTSHDRITRNIAAAGFDHCGGRCRGVGHRRGSGHRHIEPRTGGQSVAKDRKVSGHPEGGATLRQLRPV
jgi:hypothetical protein